MPIESEPAPRLATLDRLVEDGVVGIRALRLTRRMMEMDGWKPPFAGWKAEDIVTHAKEIFFSEEEIKKSARRF